MKNKLNTFAQLDQRVCIIYKENTLGCVFMTDNKTLMMDVFHGNVFKGGLNWKNGAIILSEDEINNSIRFATEKDFDEYRVRSKGQFIYNAI